MFLQVKNISKKFGKNAVLKDISFSLDKGEVLAIIGRSGGGKSTLLRILNFLEKADSGEIFLDDKCLLNANLLEQKDKQREKSLSFGLVFQQFNLFPHLSVMQNLMLAPLNVKKMSKQQTQNQAKELLSQMNLQDKENAYPHQLSGGQQQRVAIARALAMNPEILCFDEPTSALDPELTGEVLKAISNLKKDNRTMIIVTHEMNFAKEVSDKVLFLDSGEILEFGNTKQVFENSKNKRTEEFINFFNK